MYEDESGHPIQVSSQEIIDGESDYNERPEIAYGGGVTPPEVLS